MSTWFNVTSLQFSRFTNPLKISNDEFVVIPDKYYGHESDGIYKYNTTNNTWTKIMNFERDFESEDTEAAYDEQNKLFYVTNYFGKLIQIDTDKKSFETLSNTHSRGIVTYINGDIHIFAGEQHLIFNPTNKKMTKKHDFGVCLDGCNVLKMKTRKSILLCHKNLLSFYEYNILNKKWNKWSMNKQPNHLDYTACVKSTNEQFIIFFGGYKTDKISIYDLRTQHLSVSSIKCPLKGMFRAILMYNRENDDLLVFGYIRQCFALNIFKNVPVLSNDMIKLIGQWTCNENIHLMGHEYGGKHWKISIDYIL